MSDPVIVIERSKDNIVLEEKYSFNVELTLGLDKGGDFYLDLYFIGTSIEERLTIIDLSKLPASLKINSKVIKDGGYNISDIVVTKMIANSDGLIKWECLSDDLKL